MQELTDSDNFPFGKYEPAPKGTGLTMNEVPDDYYFYLWTHGLEKKSNQTPVAKYIRKNLEGFKKNSPELIWE